MRGYKGVSVVKRNLSAVVSERFFIHLWMSLYLCFSIVIWAPTAPAGLVYDAASVVLPSNYDINSTYSIFFRGSTSANIVVDGQGQFLQMARVAAPLLMVGDNKNVRLSNIVLKDFSPAHVRLGRNATLTFGDDVYIQIADNATALSSSWKFDGMNCVIDGCGKSFQLGVADSILLSDWKQLALKDITLLGAGSQPAGSGIRCLGLRSQLVLDDAVVYLDPLWNIAQGNLLIKNSVIFKGRGNMLSWTSRGTLAIDSHACLSFDYGTTFSYDSASGLRTQLIMADASSFLHLNNASLCATHTGLILSGGSVFFENFVTISSEASSEAEAIVFDTSIKAYVPLGATVDVRGKVVYQ